MAQVLLWALVAAVRSTSLGVLDGTGDFNLSVRLDFGSDNSQCGPTPLCDALNVSCLLDSPPKLQPEGCEDAGATKVQYVTTPTEQVSNYFFGSDDCSGFPSGGSESVAQGSCTPRSDDKEARQYFPLIGVCNNESTADFVKRYIHLSSQWGGSVDVYPTDVCLSYGEGDSDVFTLHDDKVFRVIFSDNSCNGTASVSDVTSRATVAAAFCLDFATVNVDWNMDGIVNNDGRDVLDIVLTTTTTTTTTTTATTTTTTAATTTTTTGLTTTTTTTTGATSTGTTGSTMSNMTSTAEASENGTTLPGAISGGALVASVAPALLVMVLAA